MSRINLSSGSPFESDMAYSRAVVQGDWIFVSGTTGFDYALMVISNGLIPGSWDYTRPITNKETAATMIVAGLMDPRMRIEIEVTALRSAR